MRNSIFHQSPEGICFDNLHSPSKILKIFEPGLFLESFLGSLEIVFRFGLLFIERNQKEKGRVLLLGFVHKAKGVPQTLSLILSHIIGLDEMLKNCSLPLHFLQVIFQVLAKIFSGAFDFNVDLNVQIPNSDGNRIWEDGVCIDL